MRLSHMGDLRSVIDVLVAVDGCPDGASPKELGHMTSRSRGAVDRAVGTLLSDGLLQRGAHRFGRPAMLATTVRGHKAAAYLRSLNVLLSPQGGRSDPTFHMANQTARAEADAKGTRSRGE